MLIIVGATIGGGVGCSLSSRKSATSSNTTEEPTAATPIARTPSITTTSTVGPSTTLILDCPSSNNTLYSAGGALFRKLCSNDFLNAKSQDVVNQPTGSLNDCINLCAGYNLDNETAIASGRETVCNAVCRRATIAGDDFPGQCFGFATQNSSGNFVLGGDIRCDSAPWINQDLA
jgi:hypothetical protein